MRRRLHAFTLAVASWLPLAPAPLHAADATATAAREKEQLQRTRAALKEATAQREALQAEKAAWEADRRTLSSQAARSQASGKAALQRLQQELSQQLQMLRDENNQLEVLVVALREQQAQWLQAARDNDALLRQQLAVAQREMGERAAVTRAVAQLLERSTGRVNGVEASNQQLHAAGLKAVEQLRQEMGTQELSITDPLGLRAVRRENTADALREALEKSRTGPAR